ncbi:hypothetical protein AWV80_22765 [Cupriavidus sp. UYMU48A]|nr:hypothetical protein AWV80_22765 [Cupriavidus sp. UYMU48A]
MTPRTSRVISTRLARCASSRTVPSSRTTPSVVLTRILAGSTPRVADRRDLTSLVMARSLLASVSRGAAV